MKPSRRQVFRGIVGTFLGFFVFKEKTTCSDLPSEKVLDAHYVRSSLCDVTTFQYDSCGRLIQVCCPLGGHEPDTRTYVSYYDASNRLTEQIG